MVVAFGAQGSSGPARAHRTYSPSLSWCKLPGVSPATRIPKSDSSSTTAICPAFRPASPAPGAAEGQVSLDLVGFCVRYFCQNCGPGCWKAGKHVYMQNTDLVKGSPAPPLIMSMRRSR